MLLACDVKTFARSFESQEEDEEENFGDVQEREGTEKAHK